MIWQILFDNTALYGWIAIYNVRSDGEKIPFEYKLKIYKTLPFTDKCYEK